MNIVKEWNYLRIPTWALSYIINADDSGITEEDKAMVDEYFMYFEKEAEKMSSTYHVEIETNREEFLVEEEILIDYIEDVISDDENTFSFQDSWILRQVALVSNLKKIRDYYKESYFSWNPEFGSACDVQECTVYIWE